MRQPARTQFDTLGVQLIENTQSDLQKVLDTMTQAVGTESVGVYLTLARVITSRLDALVGTLIDLRSQLPEIAAPTRLTVIRSDAPVQ